MSNSNANTDVAPTERGNHVAHGVLLEMHGFGVLLTGISGIGKSECALDLISRGHRLVADDVVRIADDGRTLLGKAPKLTFGFLEIRGLGIVNVGELFGMSAVCPSHKVDLCIELVKWNDALEIDRLGLETHFEKILGVDLPKFILPVSTGRNVTTLVETAVRVFMQRRSGSTSTAELIERHDAIVGRTE